MQYILPKLKYEFNALEPFIDAQTMEVHHDRHHQAYVDNLNKALGNSPVPINIPDEEEGEIKNLEQLLANLNSVNESIRNAVRNNAGGHWNHSFFWDILSPNSSVPSENLKAKISEYFGSIEQLKEQFKTAALGRFGSGWAWLIMDENGDLKIVSTPNQDNPLMDLSEVKGQPVLGLDVWEHAYYLKYQNKRADYIDAFWNVVNWEKVEELLKT